MDIYILLTTLFVTYGLGVLVFLQAPRVRYVRFFAAMCLSIMVWIIANYITNHSLNDLALTNVANKWAFIGGYAVVFFGLMLTQNFPIRRKMTNRESVLVPILAISMLIASLFDAVVGTAELHPEGYLIFTSGELVWIYIAGFLTTLMLIVRNLTARHPRPTRDQSIQSSLLLVAFIASAVAGLSLNIIVPVVAEEWNATRFGPLVIIILVTLLTYAMIRHKLFDIRFAAIRTTAYILTLITLAIIYYLLALAASRTIFQGMGESDPFNIALALILALVFQPIKVFFDKVTDAVFLQRSYRTADFIGHLSRTLTSTMDLKLLLERSAVDIGGYLRSEQAFFVVMDANGKHVVGGTPRHKTLSVSDRDSIENHARSHRSSVIAAYLLSDDEPIKRLLERNRIGILVTLGQGERMIGYLALGEHLASRYTKRDLQVLTVVADEIYIAVQNSISARDLSDLNDSLQKRIDDATNELRKSNEKLLRLDEAKDEFVSMASHQLRTPLTSIKGYLDMVLQGDVGKITDSQRKLLSEAFDSSERMVHLINDFLNVSRLQTGKFVLEKNPTDLSKLVNQEVGSLKSAALSHGIKLRYKAPNNFPILAVDESKIRQVVMNFIDNAIYYSSSSTTVEIVLQHHGGEVIFEVHDHGIGVPKAEQKSLFTKFFRADNARKQRPDGTGVGLFLAKKVVDAHHGQIIFFSTEGKGSVFGFRLPVKKLQIDDTDNSRDYEDDKSNSSKKKS